MQRHGGVCLLLQLHSAGLGVVTLMWVCHEYLSRESQDRAQRQSSCNIIQILWLIQVKYKINALSGYNRVYVKI